MTRQAHIVSFDDAATRTRDERRTRQGRATRRATSEAGHREDSTRENQRRSREGGRRGDPRAPRGTRASGSRESQRTSSRERRQREHAKARADRMFSRQFADESSSNQEEAAPRAAVYAGQMGATHRKAARMQRSATAGSVSAKVNPTSWLSGLVVSARSMRIFTVALCAVLTCVFLYAPAKQYYQAERERDQLAAEYSVIEQRNEVLDAQNDALASDAGMEDAVRQKYGYVKTGEQTAVVTGLSEAATSSARGSDSIEANVLSSSVKAPEEWYTPFLDAFFGVE